MKPASVTAKTSQVECELVEHLPLRLIEAEGRRIECMSGIVWITAYNHPADIFLRAGEVFVVPNGGLVLAEAVGRCRIRIELPRSFDYSRYRDWMPRGMEGVSRLFRLLQFRRRFQTGRA